MKQISMIFYVCVTGNFEHFQYFHFETKFPKNENLFQKTEVPNFSQCLYSMLRQIEWGE